MKRGEWVDNRPAAYHIRRRLTEREQQLVGNVVDLRGTDAGEIRLSAFLNYAAKTPNRDILTAAALQEWGQA